MIRVVFDTNVLFSAAFKRIGVPAQAVDLVTLGILTPCVSDGITMGTRHDPGAIFDQG